jgi:hypothetical protein
MASNMVDLQRAVENPTARRATKRKPALLKATQNRDLGSNCGEIRKTVGKVPALCSRNSPGKTMLSAHIRNSIRQPYGPTFPTDPEASCQLDHPPNVPAF